VVGRGTHIEETAVRPAARLGIADRVVFAGYRTDDYVDVLRCLSRNLLRSLMSSIIRNLPLYIHTRKAGLPCPVNPKAHTAIV
jgi:hypothetical protein